MSLEPYLNQVDMELQHSFRILVKKKVGLDLTIKWAVNKVCSLPVLFWVIERIFVLVKKLVMAESRNSQLFKPNNIQRKQKFAQNVTGEKQKRKKN